MAMKGWDISLWINCFFVSNINSINTSTYAVKSTTGILHNTILSTKCHILSFYYLSCRSLQWGWQLVYISLTSNFILYLMVLILILHLQQTVKDLKMHTVVLNETEWKFMALCTYVITNAMSKYKSQVQVLVNSVRKATRSEICICTLYWKFQM